jgi:cytochrome c2
LKDRNTMFKFATLTAAIGMIFYMSAGWAQNIDAGEAVFKKCKGCHQIGPDAVNKVGPALTDIVGRAAGVSEGFKYSASMVEAGKKGLVWTDEQIAAYLEDPTQYLRTYLDDKTARSAMSFKLGKPEDRVDAVAFLKSAGGKGTAAAVPEGPTEARSIEEIVKDQVFETAFLDDPANIAAGKEIWFTQCTHCHGYKAYPGKAPKLKPAKYKPTFVFKRVYAGFKKMPAWNEVYSIDEVRQVVAYVKSQGFAP